MGNSLIFIESVNKMGSQQTLYLIRASFWIVRDRNLVRKVLHQCIRCRKVSAQAANQSMPDRPSSRVNPGRAFSKVGTDYAGPFHYREVSGRDIFYWGKCFACASVLFLKKFTRRRRFNLYDYDKGIQPEELGIVVPKEEIILESPLPENELQKASDEIFMYGVSSKSEALVVRISRINNGESEAWIYLKLADGRLFTLDKTNGHQSNVEGKITDFTCDGLKIYPLCAMRRWRIFYSGMLREKTDGNDKQQLVFVKFSFTWTASSDVYDVPSDLDIKGTSKAMAEAKWTSLIPPVEKLDKTLNSYCQSGVINGIASIEDEPQTEMYLFGERIRYLGEVSNLEGCVFKLIVGCIPQTGLFVHLQKMSVPNLFHNLYSGFVVKPSSKIDIIQDGIIISKRSVTNKTHENLAAMFETDKCYELHGSIIGERMRLKSEKTYGGSIDMVELKFKVGDHTGYGFMFSGEMFNIPEKTDEGKSEKAAILLKNNRPLTIYFTQAESHLAELAGGKGSSLGKLTKLSSEMKSEFIVPKGIIVTTEAYKKFLTPEITEKIEKMKNIAYGNTKGSIHEACKTVQAAVESATLPKPVIEEIESKLKSLYNDINQVKFAVRSSATGEDTDQMSAAGQMETFLGVKGLHEILNSVKKCWASQFGYIAIEYKRQNGQILNSPMAVVIQEMVESEASGVLFTCDPVTNNPSVIIITCNYGLGESVVSGSEEPDTIILERSLNEEVKIKDITIGLKQRKIVLADTNSFEENRTVVEEVPEDKQNESCISEKTALNLGKLSLKIENYFKSLRDIEWGIKNNQIFILQSRPITSGDSMSDYEILHEFDGPMRNEDDIFTTCNVGEVMPNAVSPLGYEVLHKSFTVCFLKENRRKMSRNYYMQSKYYSSGMLLFYNHLFLSAVDTITFQSDDLESMHCKSLMISIFGRILNDPEIKAKVQQRNYPQLKFSIRPFLSYIWSLFCMQNGLENLKETIFNNDLPSLKLRTARGIFHSLLKSCNHTVMPFDKHMDCSAASSSWNMYLFAVLANEKGAVDNDVYSDFAKLLASSLNVESANVPEGMKILAQAISKDFDTEKLKTMSVEKFHQWLETSPTEAGIKYREFIKRHGHRCLNEMDIYATPWSMDPKPLIKLLQNMSGCCEEVKSKEEADLSTIIPHLKIPLSFTSKFLIKFILPNCRNGIRSRESGKSILVKAFDNVRKGFRHLSKTMVAEGYLPDAELLFFLTLNEIKEILETRSPRIIARAKHRRKLFPIMESFSFPEMSKGRPVPCNQEQDEPVEYEANLTMKGIPVSQGAVKGYARVAVSLDDAVNLKPGEILITRSTDVAWTPYFSILAGLTTEIGGLISHGAVVSREYGLPCVVGIREATKCFQTGDYVLLDGNSGVLQRLSQEETK